MIKVLMIIFRNGHCFIIKLSNFLSHKRHRTFIDIEKILRSVTKSTEAVKGSYPSYQGIHEPLYNFALNEYRNNQEYRIIRLGKAIGIFEVCN